MKKILLLGTLSAIILLQACNNDNKRIDSVSSTAAVSVNPKNCATGFCKDYSNYPWRGKINGYFANLMAQNYKSDIGKKYIWNGSTKTDKEDATSIWFSLETMKKFIWQIEHSECEKGCKDSLGIRIYYGRYPKADDKIWEQLGMQAQQKYADHHSVFMVPTYWTGAPDFHQDFDPNGKGCHALIDTSFHAKPGIIFFSLQEPPNAQNHGNTIPPDTDNGTAF